MTLTVFTDARMGAHLPGASHPESPARLIAIEHALKDDPLIEWRAPKPVRVEDILRVHPPEYWASIERLDGCHGAVDADTVVSPGTVTAALLAAGSAVDAVNAVVAGSAAKSFALVRPPGHHAEPERPMGFCFLSNVAIAVEAARAEAGCERVLIIDWDVHHGNGTERAFYERDDVLFISVHQSPLYPGSGHLGDIGTGRGLGYTVNLPLPAGAGDAVYWLVFQEIIRPIAHAFRPDLVVVSAGFDAHQNDPLAAMQVTSDGFALMCDVAKQIADEDAGGRLALVLEGGYHLPSLADSVRACTQVCHGMTVPTPPQITSEDRFILESLRRQHLPWGPK